MGDKCRSGIHKHPDEDGSHGKGDDIDREEVVLHHHRHEDREEGDHRVEHGDTSWLLKVSCIKMKTKHSISVHTLRVFVNFYYAILPFGFLALHFPYIRIWFVIYYLYIMVVFITLIVQIRGRNILLCAVLIL